LIGRPARVRRGGIHERRTRSRNTPTLKNLTFALALIQIVWLVWFFYTGLGGAQELVAHVLPIALTLQILLMYQEDYLYKRLPPTVNHILVVAGIGICAYSFIYFYFEFERIAIYAQGSYTQQDFVVGLLMFLLVMELSALAHRRPVLDQRRPRRLHALGLSQPDRFLLASRHELLSRRDLEHGRVLDRHLRALRPDCAHPDRRPSCCSPVSPTASRRSAR
jgi:hypothetical protein